MVLSTKGDPSIPLTITNAEIHLAVCCSQPPICHNAMGNFSLHRD